MGQSQDTKKQKTNSGVIPRVLLYILSIILILQLLIMSALSRQPESTIDMNTSKQYSLWGLAILFVLALYAVVLKIKKRISLFECLLYCLSLLFIIILIFLLTVASWQNTALQHGHH